MISLLSTYSYDLKNLNFPATKFIEVSATCSCKSLQDFAGTYTNLYVMFV